jgi:hypothetical protein
MHHSIPAHETSTDVEPRMKFCKDDVACNTWEVGFAVSNCSSNLLFPPKTVYCIDM